MEDTLVNIGSEIKSLGTTDDGAMKFGAWLVLYGSPEQTDATSLRDYFTKNTDFDFEDGDKTTVYYNHGLDPELKKRKLGTASLYRKDAGIWMEGQLKARDEYEAKIQQMIQSGKLGASSGVPSHLVERKNVGGAHEIVLWPLGKDASLTPTPAEFRTSVTSLKSLMDAEAANAETKATFGSGGLTSYDRTPPVQHIGTQSSDLLADAPKCPDCGATLIDSDGEKKCLICGAEIKFDPQQPRADDGKWTAGSRVMRASGTNTQVGIIEQVRGDRATVRWENASQRLTGDFDRRSTLQLSALAPVDDALRAKRQNRKADLRSRRIHAPTEAEANEWAKAETSGGRVVTVRKNDYYGETRWTVESLHPSKAAAKSDDDEMPFEFEVMGLDEIKAYSDEDTPETKHLTELHDGLRPGTSLPEYSAKVRDAAAVAVQHIEEFADVRCIKSERRWSANNHQALIELADGLNAAADEIKALADAHQPRAVTEAQKAIETELLEAELRFAEIRLAESAFESGLAAAL